MALSALETPRGSPLPPFKWWHFESAVILLCIRWYLRYALSDREVEELMQERGLAAGPYSHLPMGPALCA